MSNFDHVKGMIELGVKKLRMMGDTPSSSAYTLESHSI